MKTAKKAIPPKKAKSLAKKRSLPKTKQKTQNRGHAFLMKPRNALINEYEGNGDSENVARIKAENALAPVYRKELRKVPLENRQWMRAMKKIPPSKK